MVRLATVATYGDTVHTFVERRNYTGPFLPGYRPMPERSPGSSHRTRYIDHMVGNVGWHEMDDWVDFYQKVMGFELYQHFDDKDISTEYSALMSKVMSNGNGRVKFPINEPAEGRRKSQIEEYLEFYHGPGVQHIAMATDDIIDTVALMQRQGVEFLTVPHTYYEELHHRVGKMDEPIERIGASSASWSIATKKATCCRSSRGPSKTGRRCSSRSFSAKAAAASARETSRRSLRPSSGSRQRVETCKVAA